MAKSLSLIVKPIDDKKVWEDFNFRQDNLSYFQSWNWGDVEQNSGWHIRRVGIFDGDKLLGIASITEIRARRGHFLHVRQGPVVLDLDIRIFMKLIDYIKDYARALKASYIRMSPLVPISNLTFSSEKFGAVRSPVHNMDAENRWVLELDSNLDTLLANMRKTTRYMVKKGEKMNFRITCSTSHQDLVTFMNLYNETASLKHFVTHKHIQEEVEIFKKDNGATIYIIYEGDTPLAGAVVITYGDEAIYRHGATTSFGRRSPASYLLQWRIIQDAKERGIRRYNLWGIAPNESSSHPWHGLTLFKKGFGGYQQDFIHAFDIPLNGLYWISYAIDFLTTLRKGYN